MANRPRYVTHRRSSAASRAAAVLVLLAAAAALAAIVWGAAAWRGEEEPPPATTRSAPPPKPTLRIVFPEGFTRAQMAERIAAVNKIAKRKRKIRPALSPKRYLRLTARHALPGQFAGDRRRRSLEGFLFPATYAFTEDTTTRELVRMQLEEFEEQWAKVDLGHARSKRLTPYDVLIIASLVEEEVRVPRERRLVAAVIYNRLRMGMPLGIDATIRYGLGVPPTQPLHRSELASDTPYNTRKFAGLPPTPIANPGLASIEAAASPARVDYLYFVRKADCRSHFFTASEQEFFDFLNGPRC